MSLIVIAHRGAAKKAPENSRQALLYAWEEGAHRVEVDVQICQDGLLYLCHDDRTARTTSHNLLISQTHSTELASVHLENGETLPSLAEIFQLLSPYPNLAINLEIKTKDHRWIPALAQLLQSSPSQSLPKNLIISSFSVENLKLLEASELRHLSRALLWPPAHHISAADPGTEIQLIRSTLAQCTTHILHPEACYWTQLPATVIHQALADNLEIYTWSGFYYEELTPDRKLWCELLRRQVSGHCTNYPLELRCFLRSKDRTTERSTA